ncbi:DNA-binding transcriptional regulator, AcrR family [Amycolatopsis pretoriensis]|uniref:DNA-binding transcriptional regulator, AcrR family n=1 Tax=Amycolatopsis pretoriensis TaxID=218821 RepID=A0A1H5RE54_9PSEU|nr:ScbR family autoregulator-binding transcription factor [Amycolatopsis pretoriensis]SEF36324.1 DNA-binding transcriptional regulator, AcrR family [Amycolatopsis pretoriensis]
MTKQARSEHTRRLLLEAAAELLHQDGYAATSMVGIAQAAGVTKGGLYFHFSSKDEICDEVQDAATAVLREHVRRQPVPRPALPRLADLSRALMHWLDRDPKVGASFRLAREMGSVDERFVLFSRAWLAQVHQYLTEAVAGGELGADVPVETAELLVVVTCVGLESVVSSRIVVPDNDLAATLGKLWRLLELSRRPSPVRPART